MNIFQTAPGCSIPYPDQIREEYEVREGHPDYTGRLCVIGAELSEEKLAELFGL